MKENIIKYINNIIGIWVLSTTREEEEEVI